MVQNSQTVQNGGAARAVKRVRTFHVSNVHARVSLARASPLADTRLVPLWTTPCSHLLRSEDFLAIHTTQRQNFSLDVELDRVSGFLTDTSLLQWSAADVRLEPCLVFLAEELLVAASTLGLSRDHERQEKRPEMSRRKQTLRTLLDALNELQDEELEAPTVGGV